MRDYGERLERGPDGYQRSLRDKELSIPSHQPYPVRWVETGD